MRHDSAPTPGGDPAVAAAISFPDENPNPVMRIRRDGTLLYANRASQPLVRTIGEPPGERVAPSFVDQVATSAAEAPPAPFDLTCGSSTFAILAVPVPGLDAWNVYGTDVTGARVVEKFPDLNPNPVLRLTPDGTLLYANRASRPIVEALGISTGDHAPSDLLHQVHGRLEGTEDEPIVVGGAGRIYRLDPVLIPGFGFVNVYGTDVTATRAMTAFPDENPNPVLRIDPEGGLVYANAAAAPVLASFGAAVGERVGEALLERLKSVAGGPPPRTFEIEQAGQVFELKVVELRAFESINVYGTDVTAERERRRLLLSILPASIAERLQRGERPIADRFEEMAVLFADVVDFTPYASQRPPGEVVSLLDELFSRFDDLADRYRLEKVKTIGDAYMAAGGLLPGGGAVEEVAEMALDMLHVMAHFTTATGARLQLRIGMHVGPAVAGVIGLKKFIYDIWGDTVNTASRLESHGTPGRIQVTADTARRLADGFRFEPRGAVELKGKGATETCYLVGRRED